MIQHVSFEVKPDQPDACIEFYEFVTWLERDGDQFHLLQLPETSHMNAAPAVAGYGTTSAPLGGFGQRRSRISSTKAPPSGPHCSRA